MREIPAAVGPERVQFQSYGLTDVGRRRARNEDAFLCDDELGVWLVADGVGGRARGDVASQMTAEAIRDELLRDRANASAWAELPGDAIARIVERAVQAAAYLVFALADAEGESAGMGTTVSVLVAFGQRVATAQVGDSRIYLLRNGQCQPLTEDHTWVNWQVRHGNMTREQAERTGHRNTITRAVGNQEYVEVDTSLLDVSPDDRFFLCSDGLHGYVEDTELPALLAGERREVVERLVGLANDRGGRDNITALLVDAVRTKIT